MQFKICFTLGPTEAIIAKETCFASVGVVLCSLEHTGGAPLTRKPANSLAHRVDANIMMDAGGRRRKLGFHTALLMEVTGNGGEPSGRLPLMTLATSFCKNNIGIGEAKEQDKSHHMPETYVGVSVLRSFSSTFANSSVKDLIHNCSN